MLDLWGRGSRLTCVGLTSEIALFGITPEEILFIQGTMSLKSPLLNKSKETVKILK